MDQSDAIVLLYLLKNEGALAKGASLEQCAETFKATQEKLSQISLIASITSGKFEIAGSLILSLTPIIFHAKMENIKKGSDIMRIAISDPHDTLHYLQNYEEPDICPMCGKAIKPEELYFRTFKGANNRIYLAALYLCKSCYQVFTALHIKNSTSTSTSEAWSNYKLIYIGPRKYIQRTFDEHISVLSPSFTKIFNQAQEAETLGLDEIAGIGYRKALEFIIKDYLIHLTPEEAEKIKHMELGNCIANKVQNERLKAVASRSAWLGNDQTHYTRRFENRDIKDMKNFIEAVLYWISMELITEDALSISPAPR